MKKIFLFLFLIYSYSFSETEQPNPLYDIVYPAYVETQNQACGDPTGKWWLTGYGSSSTRQANYLTYRTPSSCYIIIWFPKYESGHKNCTENILTGDGMYVCNNGVPNFVPNPDPSSDDGQCNDLFVKDGQAYTCNPNTNEATLIPNSNGLAYDPNNDDYVPNCNDGYDWTSTPTLVIGGSGSNYTTWGCAPSTGTGDTGTGSTGDGSDTSGDNGVGGSTGTGTGDTGSTGGSGSTTGTGDTSTGGSGGSGGSVSGGGSTGGTGDTGTANPDTGDITTPPTDNPDTGDNTGTTTPPTDNTDNGDTTTPPTDGSTDGTGDDTDTTNGADSCNDPNLTLQEQMLCKLNSAFGGLGSKIDTTNSKLTTSNTYLKSIDTSLGSLNSQLTPNQAINSNPLNGSTSLIDGVINEYSTFKSNITNQGETLKTLVNSSIDTVNNGFEFNITSNEVLNCPKTYELNLSALNMQNMDVILDICEQSSKLKPYFYPLFLILFSIATTIITFRMLGVLI